MPDGKQYLGHTVIDGLDADYMVDIDENVTLFHGFEFYEFLHCLLCFKYGFKAYAIGVATTDCKDINSSEYSNLLKKDR